MRNLIQLADCVFDKTLVRAVCRATESWWDEQGRLAYRERTRITLSTANAGIFHVYTVERPLDVYLAMEKHQ